jgi:hypothetical protein
MEHVNLAPATTQNKPVQGIHYADILLEGKGIIDYYNHCLCLKMYIFDYSYTLAMKKTNLL